MSSNHPTARSSAAAMASSSHLLLLLCTLLLLLLLLASADRTSRSSNRNPGFIYTRYLPRCTPKFWSSGREEWPRIVPQRSTVSSIFGSRAFERYTPDLTLLRAASRNDDVAGPFADLLKQATAALLNSYSRRRRSGGDGFPYAAWEVKTLLIQAMVSKRAASAQARKFLQANLACN